MRLIPKRKVLYALFAFALSAFLLAPAAVADDSYVPVYRPELRIMRAAGLIDIDGELGDAGWVGAAKAHNFAEHNPGDQTMPEVNTEVLITYDEQYLYLAWICYDDPAEVRASFCERDRIFSGDYVIFCLDTYGESAHAYEIAANPYGIPGDLQFSPAYGEDISYDMIFESAGSITDFGWVVEMAIPFESLRFPDVEEQEWRVDFWRNRPRESRFQYSWAAYNRDEDCWPCQWGTVRGASGVKPGSGFELLPSVVAHQSASLNDDNYLDNGDVMGDLSLGISYDISSELTTEVTVNPDFSQIEADVAQIDVNSTFALFYSEKRPFFQEGSDLFNTYFNAVYTRSINDPYAAGKITWRNGSNSIAFLSAYDEHSVIILPFEERSRFIENGKSYSNIVRARHDFGEGKHLGLLATDRRFEGGGTGSLLSVDGQWRFGASNSARLQVITTYTEEVDNLELADSEFNEMTFDGGKYTAGLDGETFWGHALEVELERSTGSYWVEGEYNAMSPTFRADNGFHPQNNNQRGGLSLGGIKRFDDSRIFENLNGNVHLAREWNFDGVQKDEWVNASVELRFRAAQTGIHSNYLYSNELFRGTDFNDIWEFHNCISTQPWDALRFGGNINYGHRIARKELVMGKETSYGVWTDIKPVDRLLISAQFVRLQSDDLDTSERLFSQSVFWSRMSLQLSRELSVRLVAQYNDRWDTWDIDPLISYRINSMSVFYLGSTHDYRNLSLSDDGAQGWYLTDRQFFMKFQYLFQI